MTERWTMSFINQNRTLSRNRNITEQWIWIMKVGEYKARCNPTLPKLCYEIVMVRQSHGWSQSTNFKTWKSTHERIMIIMTSSSRTKSNSCAAVQVKSAGSVVTVSLVPSQCSDTRVYTHKTNASGGWPNRLDAFKFSQLLASATTTTIATTIFAILISSSFCFEIFWRHVGNGLYTRSDDVVVRIYSHQFIDIATIDDPWAASLGIPSIVGQRFFGNEGEIGEMLHCYTQIHATFVFCSVKKAKNKQIMNTARTMVHFVCTVTVYIYISTFT